MCLNFINIKISYCNVTIHFFTLNTLKVDTSLVALINFEKIYRHRAITINKLINKYDIAKLFNIIYEEI